jgi:poly(3-hydroxybutyrate) depolymerase
MLYSVHEATYYATAPLRAAARITREFWSSALNPAAETQLGKTLFAAADLFSNVTRRYGKPDWKLDSITIEGQAVSVTHSVVWASPWCKMIHFSRDIADMRQAGRKSLEPAVLIVAPLSGHYATLLRGTVETFLQNHEVYITDWVNAREGEGVKASTWGEAKLLGFFFAHDQDR